VNLAEPDVQRLLAALKHRAGDRVPVLEMQVFSPTLDHVIGHSLGGKAEDATPIGRAAMEHGGRGAVEPQFFFQYPQPVNNLTVTPEEYATFCQRSSIDAMVVWLSWSGLHEFIGTRGEYSDWGDLEKMVPAPDMAAVRDHLNRYIDVARGTNLGVGAIVHGCYARASEAIGFENLALKLYDDRAFVEKVLDTFTEYAVHVAETVADMDISFFWLFDDIADNNGCQISPAMLEALWSPRTERILAPIRAKGLPVVYHCDGNLRDVIPMALRLGIDAIQPIQPNCNDIYAIKKQFGDRLCLIGNLDIGGVLAFGTPADVTADAREHISRLGPGGGYVLGSGHSITAEIPPANFVSMVNAAVRFGRYPMDSTT
jgi:uroporphyrinogen decarboxylase